MSKSLQSKHRSGGPHSGGQPQSNQRQPMSDFARSEGRSFPHTNRTNNQSAHIQNTIHTPLSINPQMMQAQMRNFAANHTPQPGTQPLVTQQPIAVAPQQPPILSTHNINPNPNRTNANYGNYMQNHSRMPLRQQFQPRPNSGPSIQGGQYVFYPQMYQYPQMQQQILPSNYPQYIMEMNHQYPIPSMQPRYSNPVPVNMQNNMPINQSNDIPPAQAPPQSFPAPSQPKELPKRSRKPAIIYDLEGNVVDLESLRAKKKANSTDTEASAGDSKNLENQSEKVETEVNVSASVISSNGDEKEIEELGHSSEEVQSPEDSAADISLRSEPAKLPAEEVSFVPVSQENIEKESTATVVEVEEQSVDVVNISNCDNDNVPEEIITPSPNSSPISGDDLCTKVDDISNQSVEAIADKLDEINLKSEPEEVANVDSEPQIPTSNNQQEIGVSLCDNSKPLCETTNSGDMEIGSSVKKVSNDQQNGTPNEPSIDPPTINNYLSASTSVEDKDELENTLDDNSSTNAAELSNDESKDVDSDSKLANSLNNKNETKVYEKDFLISLREHATQNALSNSNPENIKDIIRKNNKASTHDMFIPNFANRSSQMDSYRNKSQQQAVRRPSQPSKNYSDSKSKKISSTSLQYDSYQPVANAWRPGKVTTNDPVEMETEKLLKGVRAILNKLTPQNYSILLDQFKSLIIDTEDRLIKVIDLIFEKAIKEPAFVVQYAGFCSQLVNIRVVNESGEVKFKNLLIKKCEETFFKELYSDIPNYNDRLKEIEDCEDPVKKKELNDFLDDDKRLSRKRSVGNIKLIAELFKLKLLNTKIMIGCFKKLLGHNHEESIECLCALITNIGANFSAEIMKSKQSSENMALFNNVFLELKKIHDQNQMSSRIRFMILDLLDLRHNKWVPRRKLDGPKTIAQVHEDMDKEARLKSLEMSELSRKKKSYHNNSQDDWQEVKPRKTHNNMPSTNKVTLNINTLKESLALSTKLSSGSPFNMFAHGSHGGSNSNSQSRSSSSTFENKYQVLSNDKNQQRSNSTLHDSLNAKDQLNRRDARKTSDVTNYYQTDNRDNSLPNSRNSSVRSDIYEAKLEIDIDDATFNEKLSEIVNAYLKSDLTNDEAVDKILLICSKSNFHKFVCESLIHAIDKSSQLRAMWGEFLGYLFVSSYYDCFEIFEGLKLLFSMSKDLIIDTPKFWQFVAEVLAHAVLNVYNSNSPKKKDVFKNLSKAFGEITGKDCTKFNDGIIQFISDSKIVTDEKIAQDILSQLSINANDEFGKLKETIDEFIAGNSLNFDKFVNNIETIKSANTDAKKFKSALYKKLLDSLYNLKDDNKENLKKLQQAFQKYCYTPEDQVLMLQESVNLASSLHFPRDFSPDFFTRLLDLNIVSKQSFFDWRTKGIATSVAYASILRFINNLQEQN